MNATVLTWDREAVAREIVATFRKRMQKAYTRYVNRECKRSKRYMKPVTRTLRDLANEARKRREETRANTTLNKWNHIK